MHKEEEYAGDTTQWLPEGAAIYTAERIAKGDMQIDAKDGQVRFEPVNIMRVLIRHDVLNEEHAGAARQFVTWRRILRHAIGADRINSTMSGEGRECIEDNYVLLVKRLQAVDLRVIAEAYDHSGVSMGARLETLRVTDEKTYKAAKRSLRNTYLDAFDALHAEVEKIVKGE